MTDQKPPAARPHAATGRFTKTSDGAKAGTAKATTAKATKAKATAAKAATAEAAAKPKAAPAKSTASTGTTAKPAAKPKAAGGSAASAAPTRSSKAEKPPAKAAVVPAQEPDPDDGSAGPIDLYFLRHADAGDPLTWVGDDDDRPLSKKGRRQAKRLGRLLEGLSSGVDEVRSSPKARAAETARLVARSIDTGWVADDRLGGEFGDDALGTLLAGLAPGVSSVMLVGHDPDFSRAVSWLVGASIEMRKGALARVSLPDRNVGAGRGSLRWLLPPDAVAR